MYVRGPGGRAGRGKITFFNFTYTLNKIIIRLVVFLSFWGGGGGALLLPF